MVALLSEGGEGLEVAGACAVSTTGTGRARVPPALEGASPTLGPSRPAGGDEATRETGCDERGGREDAGGDGERPGARTRALVLVAIAVGAFAALPPSVWHDAERLAQGHLGALEEAVAPAAERAADWFAGGKGALRDAFGQGNSGATLSGSARGIDGDTLEIHGGTRIRLYGIDAPADR